MHFYHEGGRNYSCTNSTDGTPTSGCSRTVSRYSRITRSGCRSCSCGRSRRAEPNHHLNELGQRRRPAEENYHFGRWKFIGQPNYDDVE